MSYSRIATDIERPFIVKAINACGRLMTLLGRDLVSLDEEKLMQAARKRTQLSDFGDEGFREGLTVFLRALKDEAELNGMGQVVAYQMCVNLLSGRLLIIDSIKKHPDILQEVIEKPLIIAGLPRTGTTILQQLLCADPQARMLTSWEASQPCAPRKGKDKRIEETQQQMEMLHKFVPGFQAIHATGAHLPQECIALMAFNFVSVQFELNFHVPSYSAWYKQQDIRPTLNFHKQCLQLLQYQRPKQHWVLKTPPHLSAMEELLETYPDACIIQPHRDPAQVMVSVSSLFYALQALGSDTITPQKVAACEVENWGAHLDKGLQSRQKLTDNTAQFYDVYFEQLLDDPVACIEQIYANFNVPWSEALKNQLQTFMAENQREKHGKHDYDLAMFGLEQADLDQRFTHYRDYFNIAKSTR